MNKYILKRKKASSENIRMNGLYVFLSRCGTGNDFINQQHFNLLNISLNSYLKLSFYIFLISNRFEVSHQEKKKKKKRKEKKEKGISTKEKSK